MHGFQIDISKNGAMVTFGWKLTPFPLWLFPFLGFKYYRRKIVSVKTSRKKDLFVYEYSDNPKGMDHERQNV